MSITPRSLNEQSASSVVFGTPTTGRTPRTAFSSPRMTTSGLLVLKVDAEDMEFGEKLKAKLTTKDVFSAARHGKIEVIETALKQGFDVNTQDEFGNTLFIVACQNGNKSIGLLLSQNGANLNTQNLKGHTGLHFLYSYGYENIAEIFIELGADTQIKNQLGLTPMQGITIKSPS